MMVVLAHIFELERRVIFEGLNETNIVERFGSLLKELVGSKMEVEVFERHKLAPMDVNCLGSSRKDFFGTVGITFSYKNIAKEDNSTTMSISHMKHQTNHYNQPYTAFSFISDKKQTKMVNRKKTLKGLRNLKEFTVFCVPERFQRIATRREATKRKISFDEDSTYPIRTATSVEEILKKLYQKIKKDLEDFPQDSALFNLTVDALDYFLSHATLEEEDVFDKLLPFLLYTKRFKVMLNDINLNRLYHVLRSDFDLLSHWEKNSKDFLENARLEIDLSRRDDRLLEFIKIFKSVITDLRILNFDSSEEFAQDIASKVKEYGTNIERLELVPQRRSDKDFDDCFINIVQILNNVEKLPESISEIYFEEKNIELRYLTHSKGLLSAIKGLPANRTISFDFKLPYAVEVQELIKFVKYMPNTVKIKFLCKNIKLSDLVTTELTDLESISTNVRFYGCEKSKPLSIKLLYSLCKLESFDFRSESFFCKARHVDNLVTLLDDLEEWKREWGSFEYEHIRKTGFELGNILNIFNALENTQSITFKGKGKLNWNNGTNVEEFINKVCEGEKHVKFNFETIHVDDESLLLLTKEVSLPSRITFQANSCIITIRNENMQNFKNSLPDINKVIFINQQNLKRLGEIIEENRGQREFEIDLCNIQACT